MKSSWKRFLSLALCAALVFGVLGVSALAVNAEDDSALPYHYYTYLGDSISWGYGLNADMDSHDPYNVGRRVDGSFTDIVADVLEQTNGAEVHPAASSGARLCDFRILLERGMGVTDPYDRMNDWYGDRHPERTVRLREMGPEICEYISHSDLVTIQLDINDLAAALVNALYATGLVDLNKLSDISDFNSAMEYVKFALGNVLQSPDVFGNLVRKFNSEINEIRANAVAVVDDVTQLAPGADILVIGYHKAVKSLRVIPGTDFSPLFDLINAALVSLNDYYASVASNYSNVHYVDAPDATVFYSDGTQLVEVLKNVEGILKNVHPDAAGHAYIADCVLEALKELNACPHNHTNTNACTVKVGLHSEYVSTEVCADCGKVLNSSKLVTPAGTVYTPMYTLKNAVTTVQNAVFSTANRLTFGLMSKLVK